MLIEFTVGNYLSFKDKKTLSLEATNITEYPENIIKTGKYELLRSAVIYGANSSGKSNFLKAMRLVGDMVVHSVNISLVNNVDVSPFLLNEETENEPSHFEVLMLLNEVRYRYGFEVTKKRVVAEWLFERKTNHERQLFIRDNDTIEVTGDFEEGKGLEERTREDSLFLSVVSSFNGNISRKINGWFIDQNVFSGLEHEKEKSFTNFYLKNENKITLSKRIKDLLMPLDLGFKDLKLEEIEKDKNKVITVHEKYNKEGIAVNETEFDLLSQESSGTNKLYDIAGVLSYALSNGNLVVIDELDAKLHPVLTAALVKLFNNPANKDSTAQLVFATHDTNLLNQCFRRDQIYFTEKNRLHETDMYSLVEYREPDGSKVRKDRSFEKDYIAGRYGAIPFIGDFSKLTADGKGSED